MGSRLTPERIVLVLIAAVALAGLVISPAFGGPGFLTAKKANKLFLKKKAASRLFLSTGDAESRFLSKSNAEIRFLSKSDAEIRFLSKSDAESRFATKGEAYSRSEADARFLRPEGEIRITSGPANWTVSPSLFEGEPPTPTFFLDAVRLTSTKTVTAFASTMPDIPVALLGRQMRLAGFELCYDADEKARLAGAQLTLLTSSTGVPTEPAITEVAVDKASHTDNACITRMAPSPVPIGADDTVALTVTIDYPKAEPASILLGRATFFLEP